MPLSESRLAEDRFDLRARLESIRDGAGGRLVSIVGSGMSLGGMPSTEILADAFLNEIGEHSFESLRKRLAVDSTPSQRYQLAAQMVGRQRGDSALNSVIRKLVLDACIDSDRAISDYTSADLRVLVREGRWKIPSAHRDFARFYAELPAAAQGPIITTNFDPFIEIALREVGVTADPHPIVFDDPPGMAAIRNASAVPVIHIHGYFAESWSLNSILQLSAERPRLEEFLTQTMIGATVLVSGYGGWEDALMRVLERHAAHQTLLNAEVVWAAHTADPTEIQQHPILSRLSQSPGFQLFFGVDLRDLFTGLSAQVSTSRKKLVRGYLTLPAISKPSKTPRSFSEGARPNWSDAVRGEWPVFESAKDLRSAVDSGLNERGGKIIAAIGPLGEGKSTGLMQVADSLSRDQPDWNVIWRDTGASPLSADWLIENLPALGKVVVFIDEADLAESDLRAFVKVQEEYMEHLVIVVACQDRHWWKLSRSITERAETVMFDGLNPGDASSLAERWSQLNLDVVRSGADGPKALSPDEVTKELLRASGRSDHARRSTLFGAILEVREAEGLSERIAALMDTLDRTVVRHESKVTLADVFGGICVMEHFLDNGRRAGRGATREVIGQMVNAEDQLVNVTVLEALGREASITFSGKRVYSRHPMIAAASVSWLVKNRRLDSVSQMLGEAGGKLRAEGSLMRDEWADAYFLGKEIPDQSAAIAACVGAIRGAHEFMEPRITYLSVVRKFDPGKAREYGHAILPILGKARDKATSARVFFNELGQVALSENAYQRAAGLAALAIHNGSGRSITHEMLGYALGTLSTSFKYLLAQNFSRHEATAQLIRATARRTMGDEFFGRHVESKLHRVGDSTALARLPLPVLAERLAQQLDSYAKTAIDELDLPFGPPARGSSKFSMSGRISFGNIVEVAYAGR
jgi:hypothetical protein